MEVTTAITQGLTKLIPADIHVGITGLPCPGGSETPEKPVGTMYLYGLLHGQKCVLVRKVFIGTHEQIIRKTLRHLALTLLDVLNPP